MTTPPIRPCKDCTSLYCGPHRCRFETHVQPAHKQAHEVMGTRRRDGDGDLTCWGTPLRAGT